MAPIVDCIERSARKKARGSFNQGLSGGIADASLQRKDVATLTGDASEDDQRRVERHRFAKARVERRRNAAMSRGTGGMRHDLIEQSDRYTAVCDAFPALKFRAKPKVSDDAVAAAFEMHAQADRVLRAARKTPSVVDGDPAQRPEPKRIAR